MYTFDNKLIAYLPIYEQLEYGDSFNIRFKNMIEEFKTLSNKIKFPFYEEKLELYPTFEILNSEEEDSRLTNKNLWRCWSGRKYPYILKISIDTPCGLYIPQFPVGVSNCGMELNKLPTYYIDEFMKRICDFVVAVNIAQVGLLETAQIIVFEKIESKTTEFIVNTNIYEKDEIIKRSGGSLINSLPCMFDYIKKIRWPKLQDMSIIDTWNWLLNHQGFLIGIGESRIERSLNAFTHIFNPKLNYELLFWAMLGIEAIYVHGEKDITSQIVEKTQAFLGAEINFKKVLKKMYKFRSRFIHGDSNHINYFAHNLDIDEIGVFEDEYNEALYMAHAILVATFQQLVLKGWSSVHFSYNLVIEEETIK
ncbi:hypothetical protein [Clostridium sp.]|uniref:hypothetical protein n=1 Tax=Clostridium sp. TaxID=1506 RepID=UPI003F4BA249